MSHGYVKQVSDIVKMGQMVKVKCINVDDQGRVKLSIKAAEEAPSGDEKSENDGAAG